MFTVVLNKKIDETIKNLLKKKKDSTPEEVESLLLFT
jgi:hypothetical protein